MKKLSITVAALSAAAVALLTISPASAATGKQWDGQDPSLSGCGNTGRVVKTANLNSPINGKVGTIELWWSSSCQTNWTEIHTVTDGSGTISVYTADGRANTFPYRAGNGGHHWGNMLWANNMCAWGSATVKWNGGAGGQNGSGTTAKACG